MVFEKALYWLAVALMAVFLDNHFAKNYKGNCLTDRAVASLQRFSAQADHLGAVAQSAFEGNSQFADSQMAMARVQTHLASMQEALARRQASCSRAQAQRVKMMALEQMQHIRVACPRQRIEIPNNSDGTL